MSGESLLIYTCIFHVLCNLLLIFICKLHWSNSFPDTMQPSSLSVGEFLDDLSGDDMNLDVDPQDHQERKYNAGEVTTSRKESIHQFSTLKELL